MAKLIISTSATGISLTSVADPANMEPMRARLGGFVVEQAALPTAPISAWTLGADGTIGVDPAKVADIAKASLAAYARGKFMALGNAGADPAVLRATAVSVAAAIGSGATTATAQIDAAPWPAPLF